MINYIRSYKRPNEIGDYIEIPHVWELDNGVKADYYVKSDIIHSTDNYAALQFNFKVMGCINPYAQSSIRFLPHGVGYLETLSGLHYVIFKSGNRVELRGLQIEHYFEDPLRPTEEELIAFELEHDIDLLWLLDVEERFSCL